MLVTNLNVKYILNNFNIINIFLSLLPNLYDPKSNECAYTFQKIFKFTLYTFIGG